MRVSISKANIAVYYKTDFPGTTYISQVFIESNSDLIITKNIKIDYLTAVRLGITNEYIYTVYMTMLCSQNNRYSENNGTIYIQNLRKLVCKP